VNPVVQWGVKKPKSKAWCSGGMGIKDCPDHERRNLSEREREEAYLMKSAMLDFFLETRPGPTMEKEKRDVTSVGEGGGRRWL